MIFDKVLVSFDDDSTTTIWISEDCDIVDTVCDLCEEEGWDIDSLLSTEILESLNFDKMMNELREE